MKKNNIYNKEKNKINNQLKSKSQKDINSFKYQNQNNSILIRCLNQYHANFKRIIETPINTYQTIQHGKMPQRCFIHNNMLTLYCQIDRKPLCVSCMYQQQTHRQHKVIPLNRAGNQINQDSKSFLTKIHQVIDYLRKIQNQSGQRIIKLQKMIPKILYQLQRYYQNLSQLIALKQKDQIQQIKQFQDLIKFQHRCITTQTNQSISYITHKMKQVQKYKQDQHNLVRRNIFQVLSKTNKFIPKQLINTDQDFSKILNVKKFQQIQDLIHKQLLLTLPFQEFTKKVINDFPKKNVGVQNKLQKSVTFAKENDIIKSQMQPFFQNDKKKMRNSYTPEIKRSPTRDKHKFTSKNNFNINS